MFWVLFVGNFFFPFFPPSLMRSRWWSTILSVCAHCDIIYGALIFLEWKFSFSPFSLVFYTFERCRMLLWYLTYALLYLVYSFRLKNENYYWWNVERRVFLFEEWTNWWWSHAMTHTMRLNVFLIKKSLSLAWIEIYVYKNVKKLRKFRKIRFES